MSAPTAEPGPAALRVKALVQRHAAMVLSLDLTAPPGVTVLLGPSGAGKSTTLDVIAGYLKPDQGEVTLGSQVLFRRQPGQPPAVDQPPQLRRIGYVLQSQALFPHLTVQQNLAFGLFQRPPEQRRERVSELADRLELTPLLSRRPHELSGGQRQRVALGRALAPSPQALLLDEPLSAVDLPQRRDLLVRLRDHLAGLAIPVLYVTHSEEEHRFWSCPAITLCPRVSSDGQALIETVLIP